MSIILNREVRVNTVSISWPSKIDPSTYSENVTVKILGDPRLDNVYIHIFANRKTIISEELHQFKWNENPSDDEVIIKSSAMKIIITYCSKDRESHDFFNQLKEYLIRGSSTILSTLSKSIPDSKQIPHYTPRQTSALWKILTTNKDKAQVPDGGLFDTVRLASAIKSTPSVKVCQGDLITQRTDVIVVCSSSPYLLDAVCKAGGDSLTNSFHSELKENPEASIIDVKADGQLRSKRVYFLPWQVNSDESILRRSIRIFVSNAVRRALLNNHQNIAFPAIGCGQYGCSISLVAQMMVEEAHSLSGKHGISVLFVIQPQKNDVYAEFQEQIRSMQQCAEPTPSLKVVSVPVNQGVMEVHMGDIATQKVDVIIVSASSQYLRDAVINAGGREVKMAYNAEYEKNPHSLFLSTPAGVLPSKRIFFVKWKPDQDDGKLRQSLIDLVWTVIQNVMAHNFTSLAFPAIGCGKYACSVDIVVKTLVKQMKEQLNKRDLQLTVKFVIESSQQNVYDEFCKHVLATQSSSAPKNYKLPSSWEKSTDERLRFELSNTSDEYKTTLIDFDQAMQGEYTEIIRIERIQIERWYIQYLAHRRDFNARLQTKTERRLYHGCPELAVNRILDACFNRSFAGVNGIQYGVGVYFSSNPAYSHGYTKKNSRGERHMFVAQVLIGNTIKGDSSMKAPPPRYDSTTDGCHIFVTYHDAQAYAQYLITYK